MVVCLENLKHGWTNNPETFVELVEASGSMVTFDIGHARASPFISSGDYTLQEFLESVENRIRNLHVYEIESKKKGGNISSQPIWIRYVPLWIGRCQRV